MEVLLYLFEVEVSTSIIWLFFLIYLVTQSFIYIKKDSWLFIY